MNDKIITKLTCKSIAPIENLDYQFDTKALKIGIFAPNGSGKTYLSRMFRMLETNPNQNLSYNKFIQKNKTSANFKFQVTKEGQTVEKLEISIDKDQPPKINRPLQKYIYHTFNSDYIDENLGDWSYDDLSKTVGFVLGKSNIDLSKEKEKEKNIIKKGIELKTVIETAINEKKKYLKEKPQYRGIERTNEFNQLLDYTKITSSPALIEHCKSLQILEDDFKKLEGIPDDIEKINYSPFEKIDIAFKELLNILDTPYTLGKFSEDFKNKYNNKQDFIETGLGYLKDNNDSCPFCEQNIKPANDLIDRYIKYKEDEENQIKTKLKSFKKELNDSRDSIVNHISKLEKSKYQYENYKSLYFSNPDETGLQSITTETYNSVNDEIIKEIDQKITDITKPIDGVNKLIEGLEDAYQASQKIFKKNKKKVVILNKKLEDSSKDKTKLKKQIVEASFNELITGLEGELEERRDIAETLRKLQKDIKKKEAQEKKDKSDLIYLTVKRLLKKFFGNKYSVEKEGLKILFEQDALENKDIKDVLSQGEKSIIAFAHYVANTHSKVEYNDDYKDLFFIIDDPISSLDFTHVYTLSGIIKNLHNQFDHLSNKKTRFLLFTHNSEFIRILHSNSVIKDGFYLSGDDGIQKWDNALIVPYYHHLKDIYKVALDGKNRSHTTANSIRHILETLQKFETCGRDTSIKDYIKMEFKDKDDKIIAFINDLSHGALRDEQPPLTDDDYKEACEAVIELISNKYGGQIKYCESAVRETTPGLKKAANDRNNDPHTENTAT